MPSGSWRQEPWSREELLRPLTQSLDTQGYTHTCALCALTPHTPTPCCFLGTRPHTRSVTRQDRKCVPWGQGWPRLTRQRPGGISGTNHLTASQGTLWAGQPGLGGSERFPGPGEGVAGRGAGPCLGLYTPLP